jgi:hypothetical protein
MHPDNFKARDAVLWVLWIPFGLILLSLIINGYILP